MTFDTSVITQNLPIFWDGLLVTLQYSALSIIAGLAIGLVIGLMQLTRSRTLRTFGRLFVEAFRNIPELVILLWFYYAFPIFVGLSISKFWAGLLGLSLYGGAFYSEILRAGVQSIDKGQSDASTALGMTYVQRMRRVILPQAFRRMIPPLAGQSIIMIKNTTLLSMITIPDILYQASYVSSFTYRPMEVYTFVGIMFLFILVPLTLLSRRLEKVSETEK